MYAADVRRTQHTRDCQVKEEDSREHGQGLDRGEAGGQCEGFLEAVRGASLRSLLFPELGCRPGAINGEEDPSTSAVRRDVYLGVTAYRILQLALGGQAKGYDERCAYGAR